MHDPLPPDWLRGCACYYLFPIGHCFDTNTNLHHIRKPHISNNSFIWSTSPPLEHLNCIRCGNKCELLLPAFQFDDRIRHLHCCRLQMKKSFRIPCRHGKRTCTSNGDRCVYSASTACCGSSSFFGYLVKKIFFRKKSSITNQH